MEKLKKLKPVGFLLLSIAFFFSYFIIVSLLFEVACTAFDRIVGSTDFLKTNMRLIDVIVFFVMALIYCTIYIKFFRKNTDPLKGWTIKKGTSKSIILAFGISGISYLWLLFANIALSKISFIKDSLETMQQASSSLTGGAYVWSLLYVCILAPIVEEILFRGFIFNSLEQVSKRSWFPIIVSSLFFGVFHGLFVQSVYTFIMGLILGLVYYKTRDIKWAILIHAINNLIGMLPPAISTETVMGILDIIAMIMVIPTVYIIYKMVKSAKKLNTKLETAK